MKTPVTKLMLAASAATLLCLGAGADTANTVKVTKFHQSYPYSGKATVEYTVGGTLPANAVAEIILNTDDASATFVQSNIVAGANSHVIDFASSFGGAMLLTNASFEVTITAEDLGGVQLWKNGPYWATCNVGATKPEEYGYYFWWGDTVGYTNTGSAWISVKDGTSISFNDSGAAASTYGMDNSALQSAGYIDSTGNLVAAHDAAMAHLGVPWRMPTDAEFSALLDNCTTEWTTRNGVYGRLVTGKGAYADKSIFLPAAGYGLDSRLGGLGSYGYYWSSTPDSDDPDYARDLGFLFSRYFGRSHFYRYYGQSVRSVRGFALCGAVGVVTYDPSETQTTPVPVPYAWLDGYPALLAGQSGDYEAAANAPAANGRKVWTCYMLGLDPVNNDATNDFRITRFWMVGDMPMFEFNHTTDGSGNSILPYIKPLGKAELAGAWLHVPDGGSPAFRFFAAEVVPPGCESPIDDGVQLWENGPYWATCNVGATSPEEYGYYFWWGDTVGYTPSGGTLTNNFIHPCYYTGVTWVSSTGEQMSSSPFDYKSCPTYEKENAELFSAGWIDSTTNLVAAHDAATAHLGAPWRMPTSAEIEALVSNCTTTWITTNGVNGRLITGQGAYANRSIFLPAAGYGSGSSFYDPGSQGDFWASTPISDFSYNAWRLYFNSGYFRQSDYSRYLGQPVRPVRDAD